MEKELSPCRVWLYARISGDYVGTMDSIKVCALQAHADGCTVVGSSTDEHGGWLLRPGYREMLRHIRKGEIDTVYICRMRHISRSEGHLFSFFRQLMKHRVKVVATEYNIEYRAANFKLGRKIDTYAARHQCAKPFGRRRTVPMAQYELWHSTSKHGNVISHRPLVRGIPLKPLHRMVNYESKNL